MNLSSSRRWVGAVLLVGVVYCLAGLVFGALAARAGSPQVRVMWRLAAWLVSAGAFTAHIWHEHRRLQTSPQTTAFHTSVAVALGAFGLAVGASIHSLTASSPQHFPAIMLLIWPVVTAVPAFVVALTATAGLEWLRRAA